MKTYIKPEYKVINIIHHNILATSSCFSYEPSPISYNIKNDIKKKIRMKHMIDAGANITKYPIRETDIFVYDKECINNKIIKKTPNIPEIGLIIQLDYGPKVKIFKHLQDDGNDYWYCKYLPNNGRDDKVTY